MPQAAAGRIRAQTQAVVDHHYDDTNPDKPLWLLIPGGAVAVVSLLVVLLNGWVAIDKNTSSADADQAWLIVFLALLAYFGGLFIFSYGYDLYDWKKALRRTALWGLIGLAAVVALLAVGFALSALLGGKSRSSSRSKSSGSSGDGFGGSEPSSSGGSGNVVSSVGNVLRGVRLQGGNDSSLTSLNLGLPQTPPGTCSYCARPIPVTPAPWPDVSADPTTRCPKCGQPFEPAGERAKAGG